MSETDLVQFNCPMELLSQFDVAWKGRYKTRTEALLDLMRRFVDRHKKEA